MLSFILPAMILLCMAFGLNSLLGKAGKPYVSLFAEIGSLVFCGLLYTYSSSGMRMSFILSPTKMISRLTV